MVDRGPRPAVEKRRRARSRFGNAASTVNVYVGNLPFDATEAELRSLLAHDAPGVVAVRVPRSTTSDRAASRGFGFVEFHSAAAAAAGVKALTSVTVRGRRLRARIAAERGARGGGTHEESTQYEWGGTQPASEAKNTAGTVNAAPTLEPSGALQAAATKEAAAKAGHGAQEVYLEPGDAAMPDTAEGWRIFVFKGSEVIDSGAAGGGYHLTRRRCFMFGRDRDFVHIPVDNPSCSKLHAVIQFRHFRDAAGVSGARPYVFDLDSRNGTFLNGERIEGRRFIEMRSKDVLRFGISNREYVLISAAESAG